MHLPTPTRRSGWLIALVVPAVVALTAVAAAVGVDDTSPASSSRSSDPITDISGPCDEAEHASDPRCAGVVLAPVPAGSSGAVDISGPCDEAEHANDPRCTGATGTSVDDSSGPGGEYDDSSSGPNRGDDSDHDRDDDHGGDRDRSGDDDDSGHDGSDDDDSDDDDSGRNDDD